ncbi:MAG: RelA/SpoT family protein [Nanoarchaeota archaeon]|nr:RelA/SpoT family protein [Nanoarchaeota archaeon]
MKSEIIINTTKQVDEIFSMFLISLPTEFNKQLITKAYEVAKKAHSTQYRKSGDLYITHPIEVAKLSYHYGLGPQSICAALLHDVVEDTNVKIEEIKKIFGDEISLLVEGLTKLGKNENKGRTDIEKNLTELRKMLLSASKDMRILIIKLCDRLHNMQTLGSRSENAQQRIAKETLFIYAPIAQKIGIYSLKWELEDLSFKYLYPKDFENIKQKLGLKKEVRLQIVQKGVNELKHFLNKHNVEGVTVLGRCKSMYSIYRKITKKKISFEQIYDLYAIRVITTDISKCYEILSLFHTHYKTYPHREKDYILHPKDNGYQSLHIVIHSQIIDSPVEVQIRDIHMHKLAEYGVAAHWKYKDVGKDKLFDKRITWLRELLQWEQENKESFNLMQILKYNLFDSEIFVFTPKFDIISLPQGARAIDFAYYIHTEVGDSAIKCKVNGVAQNLDKVLFNGDIVEIITNTKSKPTEKNLKIATTNKAKISIRQSLGLRLANKRESTSEEQFSEIITHIEGLEVYSKIKKPLCCKFKLKTPIIGVESQNGKEITIHNANCDNAKFSLNRTIKLMWDRELYNNITLELHLDSNSGILIDILNSLHKFKLTPLNLKNRIYKDGSVLMKLKINKTDSFDEVFRELKSIKGILSIKESKDLL